MADLIKELPAENLFIVSDSSYIFSEAGVIKYLVFFGLFQNYFKKREFGHFDFDDFCFSEPSCLYEHRNQYTSNKMRHSFKFQSHSTSGGLFFDVTGYDNFFSYYLKFFTGLWKAGGTNDAKCLGSEMGLNGEMQRFLYKFLSHYSSKKIVWYLDR